MKKSKDEKQAKKVWCRVGNHAVWRNQIAVNYEPGFGLCGRCIVQRTDKLSRYWTGGRSFDSHADTAGVRSSSTP